MYNKTYAISKYIHTHTSCNTHKTPIAYIYLRAASNILRKLNRNKFRCHSTQSDTVFVVCLLLS